IYLNTQTRDIYQFDGEQWEQVGSLGIKTDHLLSQEYISAVENSPYTKIGEEYGVKPGYFRLYNNPKKIVVIGNSITQHGYSEADNIQWTVSDMREMAASRPDSGWVTLIKKYLNDDLGLTDCKIYKGNGSTWEVAANGSRSINHILNQKTYEVKTTGADLSTEGTFADVLTEDVDLILIQLSENMSAPTTIGDKNLTVSDWINLYKSLNDLCPKAKIYQMTGFWPDVDKMQAIMSVAVNPVFNPLLISGCFTNYHGPDLKAQPGDKIYDENGNVISTVTQAVSGHPSDAGFLAIAEQFLDALFNDRSRSNVSDYRLAAAVKEETTVFNPYFRSEIFHDNSTITITEVNFGEKNSYLDYIMLGGKYTIAVTYPGGEHRHSILVVECKSYSDAYNPIIQTIKNLNQGTYRSITRNVVLQACSTVYNPWQFERQNFWITQRFDVTGLTIKPNAWTELADKFYKIPTYIKDAYYIFSPTANTVLDYKSSSEVARVRISPNSTDVAIARDSSTNTSSRTFTTTTYLEIVYM
ncbi:MAG: hypothetical protein NC133_04810, partial [Prevotella sp.]|nr:hypothetical protein [Prevotella sp.]